MNASPDRTLGREEGRNNSHDGVTDRQGEVGAVEVDIHMLVLAHLQAVTQHFIPGDQIAKQDDVGNQRQRNTLENHLLGGPAYGQRRNLRQCLAQWWHQDSPLDIEIHLTNQRSDDGRSQKARQQAQCSQHEEETAPFLELLHRNGESEYQADGTGKTRGDRLFKQKALSIVHEHPLERSYRGPENNAGLERIGQPDHKAPAQAGYTEKQDKRGKHQAQRGHRLEPADRILIAPYHKRQNQGQRGGNPASRVGLAEDNHRRGNQ